jgi:hypothetical protein
MATSLRAAPSDSPAWSRSDARKSKILRTSRLSGGFNPRLMRRASINNAKAPSSSVVAVRFG